MNKEIKKHNINYNDRADGYGPGEAESENDEMPYEKEREAADQKTEESSTKDEHGLPNQQGEIDQYSFRDH